MAPARRAKGVDGAVEASKAAEAAAVAKATAETPAITVGAVTEPAKPGDGTDAPEDREETPEGFI